VHQGSSLHARNTTDTCHIALNVGTTHDILICGELLRQPNVGHLSLAGKSGIFPTMDLITVFIADANVLLRQRLSRCLAQEADLQLVGDAADGRQVLSGVEARQPHILLLDIPIPEVGVPEVLPRIWAKSPRTKILIFAEYFEEEFIARALQHGVHGCVLKTAPPTELVKAIRTTHAGEFWVPRRLLTQVVETLRQRVEELQGAPSGMREVLSDREHEVVIWAVQGMTNTEIATQLGISAKTVKTHLQNVFRKLKISRRGQLLRLGPTSLPPTAVSSPVAFHRNG
jgi:DNA-binding NarL/FixJ family response regulator